MSFEKILERFMLLSGLNYDESLKWKSLLENSAEYVYGLAVKKELSESDCSRLDSLSGVYAYCRYIILNTDPTSGFRAGELTVYSDRKPLAVAQAIWESELKANEDLVMDSCFIFKRV